MTRDISRYLKIAGPVIVLLTIGTVQSSRVSSQTTPPTPTFRTDVEYVEVDALVTDEQGRFVSTLQKEDFQVFEDGKPQTICEFCARGDSERTGEGPAGAEPDVQSNERPFVGRVYTHDPRRSAHGPVEIATRQGRRAPVHPQQLAANDLMAMVHTAGRDQASQDFTSNKRLLLAAVDQFMGMKLGVRHHGPQRGVFSRRGAVVSALPIHSTLNADSMRVRPHVAQARGGVAGRGSRPSQDDSVHQRGN